MPDDWQDYLHLGYTPDKAYLGKDGELRHSPAYTIPYFHSDFAFITLQYRLTDPAHPADRYRFEADLGTSYYMATPSVPLREQVIVTEGAKKAIVLQVYGDLDAAHYSILAVPSQADWMACGILDAIKDAGRVYVAFDPDTMRQPANAKDTWIPNPIRFARQIGDRARLVETPCKLDDAILHYDMTRDDFQHLLKYACRVKQ